MCLSMELALNDIIILFLCGIIAGAMNALLHLIVSRELELSIKYFSIFLFT